MDRIIAFCGLDCSACEAYQATQAKDEAAKERIAAKWRVEYNAPNVSAAYVTCDSCITSDGCLGGHCLECGIRACGVEKGLKNCAECAEFESCQQLADFFKFVPLARENLLALRPAA